MNKWIHKSFKSEELNNTVASPHGEIKSTLPDKQPDSQIIPNITFNTKNGHFKKLPRVFCLSDEHI